MKVLTKILDKIKNVTLPWIILGDLTGDTGHLLSILGEMFWNAFLGLKHNSFSGDIFTGEAFLGRFTFRILALFLPFILIVTFNSLAMLNLSAVSIFYGTNLLEKWKLRTEITRIMLALGRVKGWEEKTLWQFSSSSVARRSQTIYNQLKDKSEF